MQAIDASHDINQQEDRACTNVYADGSRTSTSTLLQTENAVRVFVNGELTMRLMCSADHLIELVLGRMRTEDMISSVEEVDQIMVCEHATRVLVYLKDREANVNHEHVDTVATCCTFNSNLNSMFVKDEELVPLEPIPWTVDQVFALSRKFEDDTPAHRATYGAHSCYLAQGEEILYCCEDLGRHNAFDKVVGCAMRDGVDLTKCVVFTSGRVPTDMVAKAIRAHIPMLISKAVPTDLTVEMACAYDLTLICSAHSDSFRVFNDPLGIASADRS